MKTHAAKLISAKTFSISDHELAKPAADDVVMEVLSCGICSSEIPIYDGRLIGSPGVSFRYAAYPSDLGHEVVGRVVEVGDKVSDLASGDIVTGLTYSGCGFAEHFIETQVSLVKVPASWHDRAELAVGEPLMATMNIIKQIDLKPGDRALIVGDGFMSLLLVAALKEQGVEQIILAGHHDDKLALGAELGASHTVNGKTDNVWEYVMDLTNGEGVEISVEYAGNAAALQLAASLTKAKSRAKLVLAGAYDNDMPFTIGNYLQNRAPILVPAYPNHSFDKARDLIDAMDALDRGVFPMEKLITHRYALDRVGQGYDDLIGRADGYIKGIVLP